MLNFSVKKKDPYPQDFVVPLLMCTYHHVQLAEVLEVALP
jgi:hypothetical protein